jgi:cyclopropane-fatty-acyl-phospholipid synthase
MKLSIIPKEAKSSSFLRSGPIDRMARKALFNLLRRIRRGSVSIKDGVGVRVFGERSNATNGLVAKVEVRHPSFYASIALGGSIGAGEAYMAGVWSVDDLTTLVRIILLNQDVFGRMDAGLARFKAPLYQFYHLLRKDTRRGSRENIAAHYDLGNDFYRLFLDQTMTYSCGIFERDESTLEQASIAKYNRLCRKLCLSPGDHVLEIGSGWGGFAIHAARTYGSRVTTTTISRSQFEFAEERIRQAGVGDRVDILLEDYRDLKGKYDKLVSIEMIEAVGYSYLDTFFRVCSRLLKTDGMMALQAITIADQAFDRHKRSVDFIKRYIFPGSCIPSISAICRSVARVTDLNLDHLENLTPHYARTLRLWRERLFRNIDGLKKLGFSEAFVRMWEFYFCYCEAGFQERYLGDVQMRLIKPLARPAPLLPSLAD